MACFGSKTRWASRRVSFSDECKTITRAAYELHPHVDVRSVVDRPPTPKGSLASILVNNEQYMHIPSIEHLKRTDMIFVEYYLARFKRELLVCVDNRVFGAVYSYFDGRLITVRPELLELTERYLVESTTSSILACAVKPVDFQSNLQLCINVVANHVICSLREHLVNQCSAVSFPLSSLQKTNLFDERYTLREPREIHVNLCCNQHN